MAMLANITVLILIGMLIRIVVMAHKSFALLDAIYEYHMHCIKNWEKPDVGYNDMVRFNKMVFNLHIWRYTDILPKEKFEIIKTYMK